MIGGNSGYNGGGNIEIELVNNDGGGFADYIRVNEGTTVASLFNQRLPGAQASRYRIQVNNEQVPSTYVLHNGDKVSITPLKIQGA